MSPEPEWGPWTGELAQHRDHLPSRSLGTLGAGSDYAPFIHFLGISSMDLAYTYDRVSGHTLRPQLGAFLPPPLLWAAPVQTESGAITQ